jgi:hypothetical protein
VANIIYALTNCLVLALPFCKSTYCVQGNSRHLLPVVFSRIFMFPSSKIPNIAAHTVTSCQKESVLSTSVCYVKRLP